MMKKYAIPGLLTLLAAVCFARPATAAPASELEKKYLDRIEQLLPGMGDADLVKRKEPQTAMEKMCHEAAAPGREAERAALSMAMMTKVGPDADVAKPARIWLLRRIDTIGRDEVVPTLTALLDDQDADIRETARRALQNNPSPKAGDVLLAEMAQAKDPEWKIGMINALAFRRNRAAIPALIKLTGDSDNAIANAAVAALGEIGTPPAIKAVTGLLKHPKPALHARVAEAALKCAEQLLAEGKNDEAVAIYEQLYAKNQPENIRIAGLQGDEAVAIYEQLYAKNQPENIRIAGLQGIAKVRGDKALPMLMEIVNGNDPHLQMIAARCVGAIPGPEVTQQLISALGGAKPEVSDLLLDVLMQRGAEARDAIARLAREAKDETLKNSAVLALAQWGDPSAMESLWAIAKSTTNESHRSIALRGYVRLLRKNGKPEQKLELLAGAMQQARTLEDKKEVLSAIAETNQLSAVDQILPLLGDKDLHADALSAALSVVKRVGGRNQTGATAALEKLAKAAGSDAEKAEVVKVLDGLTAYCVSWLTSGPYKEKGKKGGELMDVVFNPEKEGAEAKWKPLEISNPDQPGRFDLGKGSNVCGYVKTSVWSEDEQKAQLFMGSDDGVKAWLNGQVVHTFNGIRACTCDEDKVPVTLKKGWNTLMLKVTQGDGDWAFCCSVRSPEGKTIPGLKYEAK
jgi:HEAT repeat protein